MIPVAPITAAVPKPLIKQQLQEHSTHQTSLNESAQFILVQKVIALGIAWNFRICTPNLKQELESTREHATAHTSILTFSNLSKSYGKQTLTKPAGLVLLKDSTCPHFLRIRVEPFSQSTYVCGLKVGHKLS